jgi:lipopolysaccharide transport system ATP-binding protein
MATIISVENLGKKYIIGHQQRQPYLTLRDTIVQTFKETGRRLLYPFLSSSNQPLIGLASTEEFWALREASFDVNEGERVGIVGRNGAGKSTLLKLVSRITEPTMGRIHLKGRLASLLEVGTGFHPELSGRENIYLNGAILGMSKSEMERKFDAIVDFAEVDRFLDTPVKRYSSGMYVRLAFAVAAHIEPEILIVDEVLAVGDGAFQKKCLRKMEEVSGSGRTILFVSHNLQAIRALCPRAILLDKGRMVSDAPTEETLEHYIRKLKELQIDAETEVRNAAVRRGSGAIRFTGVSVQDECGRETYSFSMGDTIRFRFSYKVFKDLRGLAINVGLRSGLTGEIVTNVRHILTTDQVSSNTNGTVTVEFPDICIRPGEYPLYLHISERRLGTPNIDVVDGLTPPLVIRVDRDRETLDFDPVHSIGYFSIPSRVSVGN